MKALFPAMVLLATLSGCSAARMLYPFTEHGKCIKECEDRYRPSKDAVMEAACKVRCDRELGGPGKEDSGGAQLVPSDYR